MNILVLCPHFRPDVAPTGEVMSSIADELAARGHVLHIVTALPWYANHAVEPDWAGPRIVHEDVELGRITRIDPWATDKTNIPVRALAFGAFTLVSGAAALASRIEPDVVFAMSPPITLGVAGRLAATRWRVPFVFNIQDVFPDVAVELGVLRDRRVIAAASALERFLYRRADAVTVLSDDLADNVATKLSVSAGSDGASSTPVRVIPNFVDTDRIGPGPHENGYRREFGLEAKRVVMYAGNVGMSQSLDLLISAATALADEPDLVFVVNGGGSGRAVLERRARGLANVRFVDRQPPDRLPEVLAAADVHVVALKRGLARASVPSKLYSILAAGRPVLASVDPGTEVANIVRRADAGTWVPPDDPEAFTKALTVLLDSDSERRRLGENGRRFVERWASPAAVAEAYERLFAELT